MRGFVISHLFLFNSFSLFNCYLLHPEIFPVNKLSNLNYFIKKTIITAIFILAVSFGTFTQTKGEVDVSVELGFGSEIGYDFNFKYPQIFVTPQYNVTENFWVGGGVGFLYHISQRIKKYTGV